MDILSKFNLPKYLKGKSFSEASKAIQERFKGRTDTESMDTMAELMERLMAAQEFVKQQEEAMSNPQGQMQDQMQGQGGMPMASNPMQEQMFSQMPQQQMMQQPGSNDFFFGGIAEAATDKLKDGASDGKDIMGALGSGIKGVADITGSLGQMFGGHGLDTSGAVVDKKTDVGGGVLDSAVGVASSIAKGDVIGAGLGVLKGIGGAIFGGKRNRAIDEQKKQNAFMQHNEASNDYGSSLKRKGGKLEYSSSYKHGGSLEKSSSYMKGGKMLANMYHDGGGIAHPPHRLYNGITQEQIEPYMNEIRKLTGIPEFDATNPDHVTVLQDVLVKPGADVNPLYISGKEGSFINEGGEKSVNNKGSDGMFGIDTFRAVRQVGSSAIPAVKMAKPEQEAPEIIPRSDYYKADETTGIDRGKASLLEGLRYAPALMDTLQLANLKKPDSIGLNRLNNRYVPQRVDERGIQNTVQDSISNNRDAILNSSGGSGSAARSNLLASQRIGGDAMSKAYQSATELNRQDNRMGQQFNLNVDKINLQQANQEKALNLEQQAAYISNKSKMMSQLGNNLGRVGTEEMYKRYPEMMGLQYGYKGRYNNPNGTTTGNTKTPVDTVTMNRPRGVVQNQNEDPVVKGVKPNTNTTVDSYLRNSTDIRDEDIDLIESQNNFNRKGGYLSKNAKLGKMVLDPIPNMVKKKKKKAGRKTAKKKY